MLRIRLKPDCPPDPEISEVAVRAPALIIALAGRPVPSAREISLKESPDGSTSTLASTASLPRSSRASP
ncbi:hypothetical protein D3C86_2159370 [compost metagenome]